MFRHSLVIIRELVITTLQVTQVFQMQLLVIYLKCKLYYQQLHLKYLCNLGRYWLQAPWGWHDRVTTCRSVIICEIIVHLLVIVQNKKKWLSCFPHGTKEVKVPYEHCFISRVYRIFTLACFLTLSLSLVNKSMWQRCRSTFILVFSWAWPPMWSSGQSFWLQIQRSRVRSPALPDFLSGSGSGTGSTQPREVKTEELLE